MGTLGRPAVEQFAAGRFFGSVLPADSGLHNLRGTFAMRKLYAYEFPGLPIRRFTPEESPRCETCGTLYRAVSSQATCTYYRRRCDCAPKSLIKRLREVDMDRIDYITRRRLGIARTDSC